MKTIRTVGKTQENCALDDHHDNDDVDGDADDGNDDDGYDAGADDDHDADHGSHEGW